MWGAPRACVHDGLCDMARAVCAVSCADVVARRRERINERVCVCTYQHAADEYTMLLPTPGPSVQIRRSRKQTQKYCKFSCNRGDGSADPALSAEASRTTSAAAHHSLVVAVL